MYRDERLHIIEEEPYKKGGRVKKGKKKARKGTVSQTVIVNVGETETKAKAKAKKKAGKKRKATKKQMMPGMSGYAKPGMSNVIFTPSPQAPSYFRAIGPEQQTFASLPGSLRELQEGQTRLFRELERQRSDLSSQQRGGGGGGGIGIGGGGGGGGGVAEAEGKEEAIRKSPMLSRGSLPYSRRVSPALSYDSSRSPTPIISSTVVVPPPIQTLRPLERQRTDTPPIMTPSAASLSSSSIPTTAVRVEPTWAVSTSSREAGYMGADETLPVQAPASGANMVPEDKVFESAPDSAFIPISASAPESVGDAVERAAQVATSSQGGANAPKIVAMKRPKGMKKDAPPLESLEEAEAPEKKSLEEKPKGKKKNLSAVDLPLLVYPSRPVVPAMEPRKPGVEYHGDAKLPSQPRTEREAERQQYSSRVFKD